MRPPRRSACVGWCTLGRITVSSALLQAPSSKQPTRPCTLPFWGASPTGHGSPPIKAVTVATVADAAYNCWARREQGKVGLSELWAGRMTSLRGWGVLNQLPTYPGSWWYPAVYGEGRNDAGYKRGPWVERSVCEARELTLFPFVKVLNSSN